MESSINNTLMMVKKNKNNKKKSPKVCHICNKSFQSNTRLENHNRKAHQPQQLPSGKMPFVNKCDQCIKSCKSVKSLKVHKRTAHREAVQYTCKTCFDKFQSFNLLQLHIKIKHSKKLQCTKCSKSFISHSKLKRHLDHHCKGEKVSHSFQCSKCVKSFLYQSQLKKHLDFLVKAEAKAVTKKSKAPAIYCFNCSTQFSNRKLLNRQLK